MKRLRLMAVSLAIAVAAILMCPSSPAAAGEPIATAETNWEGTTVDVTSVARKGNVLTVKFVAINNGSESQTVGFGFTGQTVCYALDEESGIKYYVLTDKEGNPIASAKDWLPHATGIRRDVAPGATLRVWMKLPAPPPEVKTISLFLNETDPIEDVPITDK